MKKYDILVIGSGGGSKLCVPAAQLGYTVAIVEKSKMGGTCLNRGCIPSKMTIYPATLAQMIRESKKFGIHAQIKKIDFEKLIKRISKTVDDDEEGIRDSYKGSKNPVLYAGDAKFVSEKVIEVNGEQITADKIFIAAGARSIIPPIPGLEGTPYMTSTEALRNIKPIKDLIVVGGGYIAVELGHAYSGLGSKVHFLVRDMFIGREDKDIVEGLTQKFKELHKVYMPVETEKVEYKNKKFIVSIKYPDGKKAKVKGDGLLIATGVKPNSDQLGLDKTTIKMDQRGFIINNEFLETNVPGVYAMGDVSGRYLFRHAVNFEGEYLLNTLLKNKQRVAIAYPPMPHAIFTYPEIAGVGMTEQDLIAKNIPYIVGKCPYEKVAMGQARLSDVGFVKLMFDRATRKLLGAYILGEEASTMIHQLVYAMTFNATIDDLMKMIYIHPALPETIRNALRDALKEFDKLGKVA